MPHVKVLIVLLQRVLIDRLVFLFLLRLLYLLHSRSLLLCLRGCLLCSGLLLLACTCAAQTSRAKHPLSTCTGCMCTPEIHLLNA